MDDCGACSSSNQEKKKKKKRPHSPEDEEEENWNDREVPMNDLEMEQLNSVINAFFFYRQYFQRKLYHRIQSIQTLSPEDQNLLEPMHSIHTRKVIKCIEKNQEILELMLNEAIPLTFGTTGKSAVMFSKRNPASEHLMSKMNSTIKQIVREWSSQGAEERNATFVPILEELKKRFPDEKSRGDLEVLLPGVGMGRLLFEVVRLGFGVMGIENSIFMIITSAFMLNCVQEIDELTIYPYVTRSSNVWSYDDTIRPVTFPDVLTKTLKVKPGQMSMLSADFTSALPDSDSRFAAVATSWFIDTAHSIFEYIEEINRLLKPGGVWINIGPLTYHYSDMDGEVSVELPFEEVIRIIGRKGFRVETREKVNSMYASDDRAMLKYVYECGFFVAVKEVLEEVQGEVP